MHYVNRTCTEVKEDDRERSASHPLSDQEQLSAYVLLGDPGAGKTEAFKKEAARPDAVYVTARDLKTFEDHPEWHNKTLFIDGLDEIRAGSQDERTPLHEIRARLDKLGRPRFRLSCREADWFGSADQNHLTSVSPDGQVKILHLDTLTETDIDDILRHDSRVPNAEKFRQEAKNRGLSELLVNPQVLGLLVKAVGAGDWPATKQQTFELACGTIIREHNPEHINAKRSQPIDEDQQLNAAGFLCALQLITGNAGFALTLAKTSRDFPDLNSLAFKISALLAEVVRTKLFKSEGENRVTPIHRHIAEFLAARYLAKRIEQDGLPIGRILALITGDDVIVVAELRGLSAWLAAFCKSQRVAIIQRDPLGVVLYGDVQDFSSEEKRRVLGGLQREAEHFSGFRSWRWATSPFGALATEDMTGEFRDILAATDRSETHQALAACVLDAMIHGARLPALNDTLLSIVRDNTWRPGLRRKALHVLFRHREDIAGQLNVLMDEINDGKVADPADELAGYLLAELYPQTVAAIDVLDYLHAPRQRNYFGDYLRFWRYQLLDQSSDSDISVLLDELAAQLDSLRPIIDDHLFSDLTTGLLARGLTTCGDSIKSARLYSWLGVGLDKYGSPHEGSEKFIKSIHSWLEMHPEIQKDVLDIGLEQCVTNKDFGLCIREARGRLFLAKPPADFGLWCLERMHSTTNEQAAHYLLQQAVDTVFYRRGDVGLTLELIQETAEPDSRYKEWLSAMLVCPIDTEQQEWIRAHRRRKGEKSEEMQGWLRKLKSRKVELSEGTIHLGLLDDLAGAYFGSFIEARGDSSIERLRNFLDHDEELVQCAIEGLRRSLERDDIPTVADIIELDAQRKRHLVGRPFLVGLEELSRVTTDSVCLLSDIQIKQAVAFYLVDGASEQPGWFKSLLHSHPQLVAEVLTAFVTTAFRSKKDQIAGVYALACLDEYRSVARLAALNMLQAFPVRCTNQQLTALDLILKAAVCNADRQALSLLIEKKLKLGSMNVAQRVRWLAVGVIIAPDNYLQTFADFTKEHETRARHLAHFLTARHEQWMPFDELPAAALGVLVLRIGKFFAPYKLDGTWPPAMSASELVSHLINQLASRSESEATDILEALSTNDDLRHWQAALQRAQFEQRAVRREASFRHPDIHQVNATLRNLTPANAGDLTALTIHVLEELADRIRDGNTNAYRQFWEEGKKRELVAPRHEEACREALLSDLQYRFEKLGIDAQPEGYYADNKRADIRVSFGGTNGFEVPIEIKKNSHPKLWSAIHDQLIAKYTREPRTNGFGIYLVFWFGSDIRQPAPTSGPRPRTADELANRLRATLTAGQARKISVCVIDVAKPE